MTALQDWAVDHKPSEELLWKSGYWDQVMFVRDTLHPLLVPSYELRRDTPVQVVSTHRSKSVTLPVCELTLPGFGEPGYGPRERLRLRCNFYNWIVSVESTRFGGVPDYFHDLFDREARVATVYAEGFQDAWVFEPYAQSRKEFTLSLPSRYDVYTFGWLLRRDAS